MGQQKHAGARERDATDTKGRVQSAELKNDPEMKEICSEGFPHRGHGDALLQTSEPQRHRGVSSDWLEFN